MVSTLNAKGEQIGLNAQDFVDAMAFSSGKETLTSEGYSNPRHVSQVPVLSAITKGNHHAVSMSRDTGNSMG